MTSSVAFAPVTRRAALATAALATAVVAACGTSTDTERRSASSATTVGATDTAPVEAAGPVSRLAVSYDGGVLVLDATLEQVADIPLPGFIRLNSAHNGRHVFVSTSAGFELLDLGVWTKRHGDHGHSYKAAPQLTTTRFDGPEPGHVVVHDDRIALFFDGSGQVDIVEPAALGRAEVTPELTFRAPTAHHGVAVPRADRTVVLSHGTEDSRTGVRIVSQHDPQRTIAESTDCPGIHGEAAAAAERLVFGCEDGVLVVEGGTITKVASADPFGRTGTLAGSPESSIVAGDYKTEKDNEHEHPRSFTLTDTATKTTRVVPIDYSYTFRGLKRGAGGEVVILGTDGALHIYDPVTAREVRRVELLDAWVEPEQWQAPMPNLFVLGNTAFVTDPQSTTVRAVDLASGRVLAEKSVGRPVTELTAVSG